MAYNAYGPDARYNYNKAPHYPDHSTRQNYNYQLKPIPQSTTTPYAPAYAPVHTTTASPLPILAARKDANTKRLIRRLKLASRLLAAILSLLTFIPLALTLQKFLTTRDETLVVDGEERTAWASGTISWYTYLYFGVASISLVLNAAVLVGYCGCCGRGGGVGAANKVAEVEGWWANLQRGGEVTVWIASVIIYRYGKEPDIDGKFKDLWGWTCSLAAREIQDQITNVDFDTYCKIQTTSFYTGLLNILALLLSGIIYIYAVVRMRSKKRLREAEGMESLRG